MIGPTINKTILKVLLRRSMSKRFRVASNVRIGVSVLALILEDFALEDN